MARGISKQGFEKVLMGLKHREGFTNEQIGNLRKAFGDEGEGVEIGLSKDLNRTLQGIEKSKNRMKLGSEKSETVRDVFKRSFK